MRAQEIREITDERLVQELEDSYRELFNLRFRWATRQLEDRNQIPRSRRNIARMKTVLRERELARALLERDHGQTD
jgi:large subunit ribosomal protein L29